MPHYVIFDRANGLVQWHGAFASPEAALADFDDKVGIDPNGEGLDRIAENYLINEVPAESYAEAVKWWESTGKVTDWPPHLQ